MSEMKIPEGWKLKRLDSVCIVERGKFGHRPRNDPDYYGGKYPFIQTGDIVKSNGKVNSYSQTLNEKGFKVSRLFPKGTVVITIAANIGDTAILEIDSCFPDSIIGMIPIEGETISKYIEYVLRVNKNKFNRDAKKGAQKNINYDFLKPLQIPIPPTIDIQQKIVQKLDHILDELKDKEKEILELQNEIQYKKLVKSQIQNILNYYFSDTNEKMKYSEIKRLDEISTVISGNAFKSEEFIKSDGIPVVTISNVGHGFFVNKEDKFIPTQFSEKYNQYLVKSNYVLLALTRPFTDNNTLKVCIYPSNLKNSLLNQRVAMLIPSEKLDSDFLLQQMQTTEFKNQVIGGLSTSLQPNLSSTKLPLFTLRIPDYELQVEISKEINQKLDLVVNLSDKIKSIQKTKAVLLKQINSIESRILNYAFSGKLVN